MTKEEKIKEAYGEYWEKVKSFLDENGWCSEPSTFNTAVLYFCMKHDEITHGNLPNNYMKSWRPKSLQGIENNNGWTIVLNKCDLPKQNLDCWFENHEGTFRGYYNKRQDFFYDEKYEVIRKDITHYQPITKPNKPIY